MNSKERLASKEYDNLGTLASEFTGKVRNTLEKIRRAEGSTDKVHLWLKQSDQYKLLTLKVWSVKYRVSLRYILETLVPFWEKFVQRRSKKMKRSGLNVRVSTLVGKKSHSILIESIKRDFPNGLNKIMYIAKERERLYKLALDDDDMKVKQKSLVDYSSPDRYVEAYKKSIQAVSKEREEFTAQMKTRPYRGNPFLPETV